MTCLGDAARFKLFVCCPLGAVVEPNASQVSREQNFGAFARRTSQLQANKRTNESTNERTNENSSNTRRAIALTGSPLSRNRTGVRQKSAQVPSHWMNVIRARGISNCKCHSERAAFACFVTFFSAEKDLTCDDDGNSSPTPCFRNEYFPVA